MRRKIKACRYARRRPIMPPVRAHKRIGDELPRVYRREATVFVRREVRFEFAENSALEHVRLRVFGHRRGGGEVGGVWQLDAEEQLEKRWGKREDGARDLLAPALVLQLSVRLAFVRLLRVGCVLEREREDDDVKAADIGVPAAAVEPRHVVRRHPGFVRRHDRHRVLNGVVTARCNLLVAREQVQRRG